MSSDGHEQRDGKRRKMDPQWRLSEFDALVEFGKKSRAAVGFGTLLADGSIDPAAGEQLWINCRMTHIFCLAYVRGDVTARAYAEHGIDALLRYFYDVEAGGFFATLTPEGVPMGEAGSRKEGYAHAFVLLAASSGLQAGIERARELFDAAASAHTQHFWEATPGLVREAWNRTFTETDNYRGINANMHTVEALLAAWDATGDALWLNHAASIIAFVFTHAPQLGYRIGEHYDAHWEFLPNFNRERPTDPFRPFGVTPGHGIEWARLMLQYWASVQAIPEQQRPPMTTPILAELPATALKLFNQAMADGWAHDGAPGMVYTTDFSGNPIVHERMHWTVCEALAASAAFATFFATSAAQISAGNQGVASAGMSSATIKDQEKRMRAMWADLADYARTYVIESPGRWYHELDRTNHPSGITWPGKPDIYHAAQAMLMPDLPLTPCFAGALATAP
ncbi:MAG: AGE family epimerase/isomerase [Arcanobacterium sp.]|nr:AGE family epimerase/isomerase [Arcanobacterium sp.]